jgi:methylated-DNA-[protein]-cysteine S-methyltransferase
MLMLYVNVVNNTWFGVAFKSEMVYATSFAFNKDQALRNLLKNIPLNSSFRYLEKPSKFAEKVVLSLVDIYSGRGCVEKFSLNMDLLSTYAQRVLRTVSLIPIGYVASYSSVARAVGGSPRAVGRIMALNPFPLLIPCHRVVASDFTLGGYSAGLDVKLEILKRERRDYNVAREIDVNGNILQVFPVEFVLKSQRKQ